MSATSVALISAGSALVASAITGSLTWLAGRSNLVRQLADQKDARREQYRREVYVGCNESLTASLSWIVDAGARRTANAGSERSLEAETMLADGMKSMMRRSAEVDLVGPQTVADAFHQAHKAVNLLADAMGRVVDAGVEPPDEFPTALLDAELQAVNGTLNRFTKAARVALELD